MTNNKFLTGEYAEHHTHKPHRTFITGGAF